LAEAAVSPDVRLRAILDRIGLPASCLVWRYSPRCRLSEGNRKERFSPVCPTHQWRFGTPQPAPFTNQIL